MAQGNLKVAGKKKSAGAQKKKTHKKIISKGRKAYKPKGRKATNDHYKQNVETSKAINSKNESIVSARALNSGSRFFLSDVKDSGKKELNAQNRKMVKREASNSKMSERLMTKLKKLSG